MSTQPDMYDILSMHAAIWCDPIQVERISRQVHRLERGLPPNPLVPRLRDSVAQWQVSCLPLWSSICTWLRVLASCCVAAEFAVAATQECD
jgi:hypothetical protein